MMANIQQFLPSKAQMRKSREIQEIIELRTLIAETRWLESLNQKVGGSTLIGSRLSSNYRMVTELFHGTDKYNVKIGSN